MLCGTRGHITIWMYSGCVVRDGVAGEVHSQEKREREEVESMPRSDWSIIDGPRSFAIDLVVATSLPSNCIGYSVARCVMPT